MPMLPGAGDFVSLAASLSMRPAVLVTAKLAVVDRGDAGAVVAAIFEPAQTFDEEIDRLIGPDVADDAAHRSHFLRSSACSDCLVVMYGVLYRLAVANRQRPAGSRAFNSTYPDSAKFAINSVPRSQVSGRYRRETEFMPRNRATAAQPCRYSGPVCLDPAAAQDAAPRHGQDTFAAHVRSGLRRAKPSGRDRLRQIIWKLPARSKSFGGEFVHDEPPIARAAPTAWPRLRSNCREPRSGQRARRRAGDVADNIDRVIELLEQDPSAGMATLATPIRHAGAAGEPGVRESRVRRRGPGAVFQPQSDSVCSRCADAWSDPTAVQRSADVLSASGASTRIGGTCCCEFAAMPPSSLEQAEKLEQLRMLQTGGTIVVDVVEHAASGIDTPADYAAFVRAARPGGEAEWLTVPASRRSCTMAA